MQARQRMLLVSLALSSLKARLRGMLTDVGAPPPLERAAAKLLRPAAMLAEPSPRLRPTVRAADRSSSCAHQRPVERPSCFGGRPLAQAHCTVAPASPLGRAAVPNPLEAQFSHASARGLLCTRARQRRLLQARRPPGATGPMRRRSPKISVLICCSTSTSAGNKLSRPAIALLSTCRRLTYGLPADTRACRSGSQVGGGQQADEVEGEREPENCGWCAASPLAR